MRPELLPRLCDPVTHEPLELSEARYGEHGRILEGVLSSPGGRTYPVTRGVPRLLAREAVRPSVDSFGDEWNFFNFIDFKDAWLRHTVKNTFDTIDFFRGKTIVDAGGGSGSQSLWMLESQAGEVITLELSHSVDDVIQRNLFQSSFRNFDVIQCSIDAPPLRAEIADLVYCHNVIQHTPSVENTARALFRLVRAGGEFAFNCYPLDDRDLLRWTRYHLIYTPLRRILSRLPFGALLAYSRMTGLLRLVPLFGVMFEKAGFCSCGEVPPGKTLGQRWRNTYRATVLNTFDLFGSHTYQHHKRNEEIMALALELQPDQKRIGNWEAYFRSPPPIGCALRIGK